ncbi:MAG: threonylcarbamoyl-AMP synthase [Acidobacteria bacterium RIFCSPLOWO2_12_FULL_54_10]|nr:MAG: threonylcarbamoyl-AMP synthase [Acidobacteria bacterium RIFCSPLOWO2_12_FULL_54_10]
MTEIIRVDATAPDMGALKKAAMLLRQGEVVAIPTDTVYGLAANPFDAKAVEKVFALKGRAEMAPLLLLVDSVEMAAALGKNLPQKFFRLAQQFWPGPLTMVVEASQEIPSKVTAGTGTIGLRWPAAAIPVGLVRESGFAVTGTSANLTGKPACIAAEEVAREFGERLQMILDGGPSRDRMASTVLRIFDDTFEMVREGAVSREKIELAIRG